MISSASTAPVASSLLEDSFRGGRKRHLRRCYCIVAALCTSATLASSLYAILCGVQLKNGEIHSPDFVEPLALVALGIIGTASTLVTGIYAVNTRTYRG